MEKNLPTRRDLLLKSGAGLIALAGVSNSDWMAALADTVTVAATPSQTEGPYFVEEKLNRSDIRVDPATSLVSAGFPLVLGITASRISNGTITPLSGAYIDVWHCDATGIYSDEQANGSSGKKFLRGYQVSDGHGNVRFTTVYPGWYQGRTVHIHFKVRMYSGSSKTYEFNSQLYFDEATTTAIYSRPPYNQRPNRDTFNATDGIYRGGGSQLMLRMAQAGTHALSSFHVMLNA